MLSTRAKLFWIVGLIGVDQWTKVLAVQHIQNQPPMIYLGGMFRMEYAENSGAFLSLGAALPAEVRFWIFIVAVGGFLLGAAWVLFFDRKGSFLNGKTKNASGHHQIDRVTAFSLSIIVGGGIGNLIDRIMRPNHGVIDFLNVGFGNLRTGIFNIADMAIMLGVILLGIKSFRGGGENTHHELTEKQKEKAASRE